MSLTTDGELFKKAEKYSIQLNAIVYKDQLYDMQLMKGGYIINMADSDSMGTHWVSFWIDDAKKNDAVVYFDSFGVNPPMEVRNALKKIALKILVSDKQIQNINSGWCGIYNLFFLWFMQNHSKGHTGRATREMRSVDVSLEKRLDMFLNLFSDDVEQNLTILKKLFLKTT